MTPDDKRRLARIDARLGRDPLLFSADFKLLHRLLDEAIAERDAAMAALRPFAIAADDLDEKTRDNSEIWESPVAMGIEAKDLRNAKAVLAVHSKQRKELER